MALYFECGIIFDNMALYFECGINKKIINKKPHSFRLFVLTILPTGINIYYREP